MKITKVTFEGTPEEFKGIDYVFTESPSEPVNPKENKADKKLDPKDAYKAMLKRIEISKGQLDVYKALANGELEYKDYLAAMGKTSAEIAGVHGALGRRINNTKEIHQAGLPGHTSAIMTWRQEGKKGYFSLKPDFLEVLKEEGLI
jgi:hypothetical protein